jgi:hypothetical protein
MSFCLEGSVKRSIYLLFLIVIACAPTPTATPTATRVPLTATAALIPTETPEPTATPEGFQTGEDGNVQVFENGKWVELKAPEGIWGPVDGTSVVLVDDGEGNQEAYTRMKLEAGFKDGADGDDLVNVAEYNKDTKEWELVPEIAIVRSFLEMGQINPNNFQMFSPDITERINFTGVVAGPMGIKIDTDPDGKGSVSLLSLYKNIIFKMKLNEINIKDFTQGDIKWKSVNPNKMGVNDVLEVLSFLQKEKPVTLFDVFSIISWFNVPEGAVLEDCSNRRGFPPSEEFITWCEQELAKGDVRKIPTKSSIEQVVLFGSGNLKVNKDTLPDNPSDLWDLVKEIEDVSGTWKVLSLQQKR